MLIKYIMVLGLLVYEALDIIYFTGKIGYNGISNIYNWYYSIPKEEEKCCQQEMIDELKKLNEKIEFLKLEKNSEINFNKNNKNNKIE